MGKATMLKLEGIADDPRLISEIPIIEPVGGLSGISETDPLAHLYFGRKYDNPERDENIFYEFVRNYGQDLDMPVIEQETGFIDSKRQELKTLKRLITEPNVPLSERVEHGLRFGASFLLTPISYPLLGGITYVQQLSDGTISINMAKFRGPIGRASFWIRGVKSNGKPHEYMHAYEYIATEDLRKKGLLPNIERHCAAIPEPPEDRIPTRDELKSYERKFLRELIRQERRFFEEK
ncbi:hypothetical protein ACFLZB_03255 [Nanoarchaeota archaeon]